MTYQINLGEKQPKEMLQDVSTRWKINILYATTLY